MIYNSKVGNPYLEHLKNFITNSKEICRTRDVSFITIQYPGLAKTPLNYEPLRHCRMMEF